MKTLGYILILVSVLTLAFQIKTTVVANYRYEKQYLNLWELADKSSTIPAKQQYITQFLTALQTGKTNGVFSDYNAIWLWTPNNNFDANVKALQSLSDRLTQIQDMDPESFQYNTAIQQITAQEQGEASKMLSVFEGCWTLKNATIIWGWIGTIVTLTAIAVMITGLAFLVVAYEWLLY